MLKAVLSFLAIAITLLDAVEFASCDDPDWACDGQDARMSLLQTTASKRAREELQAQHAEIDESSMHESKVAQLEKDTAKGLSAKSDAATLSRLQSHSVTPSAPLLVLAEGCTGSTEVEAMLHKFLEAKGITPFKTKGFDWEFMLPGFNPFYAPSTSMTEAEGVKALALAAAQENTTLLIKSSFWRLKDDGYVLTALKELGTKTTILWRQNVLDWRVCTVRDCFPDDPTSYPVDESGNKNDLCFERRKSNITTKAFLDINALPTTLRAGKYYLNPISSAVLMDSFGFQSDTIHAYDYETLFAYEDSSSELGRSVSAWRSLMASFGFEIGSAVIEDILRPGVGSRPIPPQHETIYNLEQVSETLMEQDNADLLPYLRISHGSA